MSRAVMQQVLAALEGGDVMCEVIAAGMLRTELAKPKAAPDLLEALETLIDVVGLTAIKYEAEARVLADVVRISRAALNKAKGVTP
jgi:hypothetical protein